MKQLTYNERVQAIAEKMARKNEPAFFSVVDSVTGTYIQTAMARDAINRTVDCYMDFARIAVAEMVEQFNNGWSCGVLHANNNDGYKRDDCLKRLGLIPDEGQEAGSDEG